MKKWLNQRTNQISILLIALSVLVVSNIILPSYDTLAYFQDKSASLERQYQHLYGYSLHVRYHEENLPQLQQQLSGLEDQFATLQDTTRLQNLLGIIQRKHRLKVEAQAIKKGKLSPDLEAIQVSQTLNGKYDDLVQYLTAASEIHDSLLLENCDLENRDPLSEDPLLVARLQFTLFLPAQ